MKKLIVTILFVCALFAPVFAQEQDQAKQLMDTLAERMREIEQLLARAALEPEDLENLVERLMEAKAKDELDRLPEDLRKLLEIEPDALEDVEKLEKLLREHYKKENDLEEMFGRTQRAMEATESDIEKLMELAEQMQQQMNQQGQGGDPQDSQGSGPKFDELQQERETENESAGGEASEGEGSGGEPSEGSPKGDREVDPNAWDMILPRSNRERGGDPDSTPKPSGWKAEAQRYFRLLAQQARRERERQERMRRMNEDD